MSEDRSVMSGEALLEFRSVSVDYAGRGGTVSAVSDSE